MKNTFFLFILLTLSGFRSYSQNSIIKGKVIDAKDKSALIGAGIALLKTDSSLYRGASVDTAGNFSFENIPNGKYILKISYISYKDKFKNIEAAGVPINVGIIALSDNSVELKDINIIEKLPPVTQKGDTTQFNAGAFKTNPDATAEDLVTKMPGITTQNGTVQAQGENVQQVLVDGKPYFGDDAATVLKNLPADVIDKIQVFDKKSDQAQFTGIDDGNTTKTLNIITKPKFRNGEFGKIYAGYADGDKYKAGGNINIFDNDRRITVLAQSNNINEQNFSTEDLLGVVGTSGGGRGGSGGGGSGGSRGGGGRGGSGGGGAGGGSDASNFLVNQQSGISTTNSIGVNYTDKWSKKVDVTASYFFNSTQNKSTTDLLRQYVLPSDSGLSYTENDLATTRNMNHRANLRLEYKIDSMNSILFQPKLSVQKNSGTSNVLGENTQHFFLLNNTNNQVRSDLTGVNFSGPLLIRHKFHKGGRTISLSVNAGYNENKGPGYLNSLSNYFTDTTSQSLDQYTNTNKQGRTLSSSLNYTEPLKGKSLMQFNYGANYNHNNSDKETFNYSALSDAYDKKDTLLTSTFISTYLAQSGGISYRYQGSKMQVAVGSAFQVARLQSDQQFPYTSKVDETFQSILPNAMLRYNFTTKKNLRIFYRASNTAPSATQLQNVLNNSNPVQLSIGNPNLKQDYQNNITIQYSATGTKRVSTFFVLLGGNYTQNYLGSSTFIANHDTVVDNIAMSSGTQFKRPTNLNGYANVRSFIVYGVPINKIKSNINFNFSANYTRTPGLINDQLNYSNAPTAGLGLTISSNISPKIDFTVSSNSNMNYVQNTLQKQLNSSYFSQITQLKANWIIWKGLLIHTDLSHQYYNGLSQNFNQDYLLWNGAIAYKFLKDQKAELRFLVFDILDQNKSIQRNITDTYIEDVRTNVLQRYFMVMFTYNIKNYKNTSTEPDPDKKEKGHKKQE